MAGNCLPVIRPRSPQESLVQDGAVCTVDPGVLSLGGCWAISMGSPGLPASVPPELSPPWLLPVGTEPEGAPGVQWLRSILFQKPQSDWEEWLGPWVWGQLSPLFVVTRCGQSVHGLETQCTGRRMLP